MHLSDGSGEGSGGEPVAVIAAHLVLSHTEIEVVVLQVLVAQACLSKHLAELSAVFDEDRCRLLVNLCVGGFHGHIVGSLKSVGIRAVVVAVLTANREIAFQYGIAEDELRGPEIIGAVGIALDGTVNGSCTDKCCLLRRAAWRLGVVEETIDIQVDTQLSHLAVVIGVENVLLDTLVLPDITRGALCQYAVLKHICQVVTLCFAARRTVEFVVGTKGVVLVDHIVQLQLR